jgi:hypothetical protein
MWIRLWSWGWSWIWIRAVHTENLRTFGNYWDRIVLRLASLNARENFRTKSQRLRFREQVHQRLEGGDSRTPEYQFEIGIGKVEGLTLRHCRVRLLGRHEPFVYEISVALTSPSGWRDREFPVARLAQPRDT